MGLKFFHVVFVVASVLLAGGVAAWAFGKASAGDGGGWWALAAGGALAAVGLVAYGVWFLRKTKDMDYM